RSLGVRYVLLPDTKLDYSSVAEAKLLRSGQSGLVVVGRTSHWTFYELPRATPIVTGAVGVGAQLVLLQSDRVWVDVSQPGVFLVRVRYSPYWRATGGNACVSPGPYGMTQLTVSRPGLVRMTIHTGMSQV